MIRLVALILILVGATAGARADGLLPELDLSSPRAAYGTLVAELAAIDQVIATYRAHPTRENFTEMARRMRRLGLHIFDLSQLPPALAAKEAAANLTYLADILHRLPEIPPDSIPGLAADPATMPARWSIPGTEIRFVRMTDGPFRNDYIISADTLERLPGFHREVIARPLLRQTLLPNWRQTQQRAVGPLLAGLPVASLPHLLQADLYGTPLWKLVTVAAGFVAVLLLVLVWMAATRRWTRNAARWLRLLAALTVPLLLIVAMEYVHGFNLWELLLQTPVADVEIVLATLTLYVGAAWAAWIAWWFLAEAIIASPVFPDDVYDANLLRLVARVGSLGSAAALVIYGAADIGVPGLGVLAGFSIGGVALALAAQSTVENLLGGVSIFADRPFRVGDLIRYGETEGTVETIGPRSTAIRGRDGTVTTVPNADLAKLHITNLTRRAAFRFLHRMQLAHGATAGRVAVLLTALRRLLAEAPLVDMANPETHVRLVGLEGGMLEIEVQAFLRTAEEHAFLDAQEQLLLAITRTVEECGVPLAGADLGAFLAGPAPHHEPMANEART